jgi:hypothetical protein
VSYKTGSPAFDGVEGWGRSLGLQDLGIFLWCGRFFSALEAKQGQEISGVEWIAADGLLSSGAQGDVDAAIVGQDEDAQVVQHLFALIRSDVGILRDLFLGLLGG